MPTYEYECQKCGHRFEEFQSITAPALQRCPKCRGKLKRLIGPGAGLLFKGSGFYTTDYRKPGYQERKKAEHGGAESAGGGAKPAGPPTPGGRKPGHGSAGSPGKKAKGD